MKKILILILFLFSVNSLMAVTMTVNDGKPVTPPSEQISIDDVSSSSGIGPVSLPLFPDVEAWKGSVITVKFNRNLGDATVIIYDGSGYEVDYAFYDTSLTGSVTLSVPTAAGRYRLYIETANSEKEGYFDIL